MALMMVRELSILSLQKDMLFFIGEQAKRARRYLVMFMETRDIYVYIRTSVSNMHALVSVLRIKFKS